MNQKNRRRRQTAEPCECLRPVIRIFGIMTSFVICGIGIDVFLHGFKAGLLILMMAVVVFIIEIKWLLKLFLELLVTSASPIVDKASGCFRIVGSWRPCPLYVAVGTGLIMWPQNLWISYVGGVSLIILATLRLCTVIKFNDDFQHKGLLTDNDFEKGTSFADIAEEGFSDVLTNLEDEEPIDDIC